MKNLKFGAFCVGLAALVGMAVAGLKAQNRFEVRQEPSHGNLIMLDGLGPSTSLRTGSQLGVTVSDLAAKEGAGVTVDEVIQDSAAEKAGLKVGDVVVEFDGELVRSARQFTRLIQETPDGRTVKIAVLRDGKRQSLDATPEARSFDWSKNFNEDWLRRELDRAKGGLREFRAGPPLAFEWRGEPGTIPGMTMSRGRLGVTVESLSPQLASYFGVKDGGALVSTVTRDSAAEKAGIKAGDVITSVNGARVRDAQGLIREIGDATATELSIGIVRDKQETTLKATVDKPKGLSPRSPKGLSPRSRPGVRL